MRKLNEIIERNVIDQNDQVMERLNNVKKDRVVL